MRANIEIRSEGYPISQYKAFLNGFDDNHIVKLEMRNNITVLAVEEKT